MFYSANKIFFILFFFILALCAQETNPANLEKRMDEFLAQAQNPDLKTKEAAIKEIAATGKEGAGVLIGKLNNANPKIRKTIIEALGAIGEPASACVPTLVLRALTDQDQEVRKIASITAVSIYPKSSLKFFEALESSQNPDVRLAALEAMIHAKVEEKSLIQALIKAISKETNRSIKDLAEKTLVGMGEKAVPSLKQGLQSNAHTRKACAQFLGKIKAISAIIDLVQLGVREEDIVVSRAVVSALCNMGKDVLPVLNQIVKHSDWRIRKFVFIVLESMGKNASPSLSLVKEGLEDQHISVREAAKKAYSKITGISFSSEENLKKYIDDLQKGSLKVQLLAAKELGEMGEKASAAIPAITESIKRLPQRDSDSRAVFFTALSKIGTLAVPALAKMLEAENPYETKRDATKVLAEMGSKAKTALPSLVNALGQNLAMSRPFEVALKKDQVDAIDKITEGKPAPVLIQGLKNADYRVRIGSARAIASLEKKTIEAVAALVEMTKDKNESVKNAALSALKSIGESK